MNLQFVYIFRRQFSGIFAPPRLPQGGALRPAAPSVGQGFTSRRVSVAQPQGLDTSETPRVASMQDL